VKLLSVTWVFIFVEELCLSRNWVMRRKKRHTRAIYLEHS